MVRGHVNHRGVDISTWVGCVVQWVGRGLGQVLGEAMLLLGCLAEAPKLRLGLVLSEFPNLLLRQCLRDNIRM